MTESSAPPLARTYGWLLAIGYGAAFVHGLIATGETWDFLVIDAADTWLHAVSAVVGPAIALGPARLVTERWHDHRGRDPAVSGTDGHHLEGLRPEPAHPFGVGPPR